MIGNLSRLWRRRVPEPETVRAPDRIGFVITAFKIGPVLSDTVFSVLDQTGIDIACVVIVVDGCPQTATTQAICRRFAAAHPDIVRIIWLKNGGVSRARNIGVDWVLKNHDDVAGIYLVDGDDLILPNSARTSLDAVATTRRAEPDRKIGWVNNEKAFFGSSDIYHLTPHNFREKAYMCANISQPSCLYMRELFDDGVLWDESMRQGIEDWEYWLTAIGAGYSCAFNDRDYLRYRQLRGNRSSVNRRNDAFTIPYMREKHAGLYGVDGYLENEHASFPRWAICDPDGSSFDLATDPLKVEAVAKVDRFHQSIGARVQRNDLAAYIYDPYFPDLVAIIPKAFREKLVDRKLLTGILAAAEHQLLTKRTVYLVLDYARNRRESRSGDAGTTIRFTSHDTEFQPKAPVAVFMCLTPRIQEAVAFPAHGLNPENDVARMNSGTAVVRLQLPQIRKSPPKSASVMRRYTDIETEVRRVARDNVELRDVAARFQDIYVSFGRFAQHRLMSFSMFGCGTVYPSLPDGQKHDIALILPGHVPVFCHDLLNRIIGRSPEIRLHVFFTGEIVPKFSADIQRRIATLTPLRPWLKEFKPPNIQYYIGVPQYEMIKRDVLNDVIGLWANMDSVICFSGPMFSGALYGAKKLGAETILIAGPDEPVKTVRPSDPYYGTGGAIEFDPIAAQVYSASYSRIFFVEQSVSDRLLAVGVPRVLLDENGTDWCQKTFSSVASRKSSKLVSRMRGKR